MCNMPLSDQCGTYFPLPVVNELKQCNRLFGFHLSSPSCLVLTDMRGFHFGSSPMRWFPIEKEYCHGDHRSIDYRKEVVVSKNYLSLLLIGKKISTN